MIPSTPTPAKATRRLRRHPPTVRPHSSGAWTVCIGKVPDKTGKRLRPKDWYFQGTEADANAAARRIADKWAFTVKHWEKINQPTLTAIDSPFADQPHWIPAFNRKDGPVTRVGSAVSDSAYDAFNEADANRRPTAEEMAGAYDDIRLSGVFSLWKMELERNVADGDTGKSTEWTVKKNIRGAMQYFDENVRMDEFNEDDVRRAKSKLLATKARRTAENYLGAFKSMLAWFYGRNFSDNFERPADFDKKLFRITNATNTDLKIPTTADLKLILENGDDRQRLYAMLALNSGMYAVDIGRLTLDEINLKDGYIFWDREKQPNNQFKVRHDLWDETKRLVKQFIQPAGAPQRLFLDYRGRQLEPTQIDCSTLAFVDDAGDPLYRVRPSGKAYDKLYKSWQELNQKLTDELQISEGFQFHNLRKATNQLLKTLLRTQVQGEDMSQLIAIEEISKEFLSQKTTELARVYEQMGEAGFARMNRYLGEIGDLLRKAGVFKWSTGVKRKR